MDELQEALHKFEKASGDLDAALAKLNPEDETSLRITLGVAKRVRTASTLLVKRLAQARDTLQDQEVHK